MVTRPRKNTGLWGLDFAEGRLRLVHVRRDRRRLTVDHAVALAAEPAADDAHLADLLRRVVEGSGASGDPVSLALPATAGYICCDSPDESTSSGAKTMDAEFITGAWTAGRRDQARVVSGVANRQAAERAVRIAQLAGMQVGHLALSQAAVAAALGVLAAEPDGTARAGFAVDSGQVRFVLARDGALLASRSTPREPGAPLEAVFDAATQMFRAAEMTGEALPAVCGVIADELNDEQLGELSGRLGVELRRVRPGRAARAADGADSPGSLGEYAVALGATVVASGSPAGRMDLLEALRQGRDRKPVVRRGFLVTMLAVLVVGVVGATVVKQVSRRRTLARLQKQYDSLRPLLERQQRLEQTWRRLRPWMGAAQGGRRVGHLEILDSITGVFPAAAEAYVTDMDVTAAPTADGKTVAVSLRGRAGAREILHSCVGRLHDLDRFNASLGVVSDVPQAQAYPKTYEISITIDAADHGGE